jgi:predicted ArsR family transcriptional regulator
MSTRQEILDHLEKHAYTSAEDLAQVLAKTRADIQYHLKQMELSGLISPVYPNADANLRGRPRRYFSLAPASRPHNLVKLAVVLLEQLLPADAPLQTQMDRLAAIARQIIRVPGGATSATARLNRLVRELSNHGYQARWEAHAAGPEIVFRNCPYSALLPKHPELCRMDALILENHLGQPMLQTSRIQLPSVAACRFCNQSAGQ